MTIHAHILVWNEMAILPFVIKHHRLFCDKIYIYDNHSSDGSAEYAMAQGCEVIPFGDKTFNDETNMRLKNECWKVSRGSADWVIVCDCDEILFSVDLKEKLLLRTNECYQTIIKTTGWQIMSEEMPFEYLTEITNGYEFKNYAKCVVFNPNEIKEINYGPGAHECSPTGNVLWSPEPVLYVLHYKHIGGVERTINRYREYMKRMSKTNLKNGWGIHYRQNERQLRREWKERMEKSKPLF